MKIGVFSAKAYDREFLSAANGERHELGFFEPHLHTATTALAQGCEGVCAFVNDRIDAAVIADLSAGGTRLIAMRCAGFNNIDLAAARGAGVMVVRVPAYSPHAVAEHAVALMLALNRKLHRAYNRVREGNFALGGLLGFDLYGKTAGVVGTGQIGTVAARILRGFGCRVLAYDLVENEDCRALGVEFVEMEKLLAESDIVSLHCPLSAENHHLIDAGSISRMKDGVMLINTSRGGLVDTSAVIGGLKTGKIGYLGLDVYEAESELFFEDLSGTILRDDTFSRLLTFPNVLVTGHQAFFTREALERIAGTTIGNITEFEESGSCANAVSA